MRLIISGHATTRSCRQAELFSSNTICCMQIEAADVGEFAMTLQRIENLPKIIHEEMSMNSLLYHLTPLAADKEFLPW